jgi:hypothetical protein
MKKFLLLIFILITATATAQQATLPVRFVNAVKIGPDRYEGKDTFEWQYTIANNILTKEKDGASVQYKNVSLGKIYKTDIQNPLQVVVFYRDFNTAILLDNQLNETSRINFSTISTPLNADAVSLASQNRLWVFDINEQRLGLYSPEQNQYKAITPPFSDPVRYYQSDYNYFYWIDTKGQCFASNVFGKINFLGQAPDFEQVQFFSDKYLMVKQGNTLSLFNMQNNTATRIEIVENSFKGFHYAAQILSIFTEQEINQYQITLPE